MILSISIHRSHGMGRTTRSVRFCSIYEAQARLSAFWLSDKSSSGSWNAGMEARCLVRIRRSRCEIYGRVPAYQPSVRRI